MSAPVYFVFSSNSRCFENGQCGPRPPLTIFTGAPIPGTYPNSLRRMQDSTPLGPPEGYVFVSGTPAGSCHVSTSSLNRDALVGFSGNRISMAVYRPNTSVQPWCYLGDTARMGKVRSDGTGYNDGIEEPQVAATAQIGGTQFMMFLGSQIGFGAAWGAGGAIGFGARASFTPVAFIPDYGAFGEGSVVVSVIPIGVAVNSVVYEGPGTNPALIEELLVSPTDSTIASISYDGGAITGMCSIVTSSTVTVGVNSVYRLGLGGEFVRVVSVVPGPGTASTIRCNTNIHHSAGELMTGWPSLRVNCPNYDSLPSAWDDEYASQSINGLGGIQSITGYAAAMQGRQIQATDVLHFLCYVAGGANITNCVITFNLDPNIIDFTTNALQWTIAGGSFSPDATWLDINIPVSSLVRLGTNTNLSLATGVNALQIAFSTTATVSVFYDALEILGTYGPTVTTQEQSVYYAYKYRSIQAGGAQSNPSPVMRAGIFPEAQSVQVEAVVSPDPQVDTIDFYRYGASLLNYTYVGSIPNTAGPYGKSQAFVDGFDDLTISNNPLMAYDDYQPFPSIDLPAQGYCNTFGYNIVQVSGTPFNVRWGPGTLITINGVVYQLYNRPTSTTQAVVLQDAGTQLNVPFSIPQPILFDQPMPALWGPTPNVGYFFACGDPLRPGTLYFTKGNMPDSAPQTNQIEVTGPDEPLMNGCVLNGIAMVFSTERAWWIYPNFATVLATVTGVQGNPFYLIPSISNRGLYARFGICTDGGGTVYFVAKDGIWKSGGGPATCVTDLIYSLFPHESSRQSTITVAGITVNPPDYTNPGAMNLAFAEDRLYFDYEDSVGTMWSLVMDARTHVWNVDIYPEPAAVHCVAEGNATGAAVGIVDGNIWEFDSSFQDEQQFSWALQSTPISSGAPGWQHSKELNLEYQAAEIAFQLSVDPEGVEPGIVTFPAATAQTKQLAMIPPNKFKLGQYLLEGESNNSVPARVWTEGFEIKQGLWGREDGYQVLKPFAIFGQINRGQ